MNDFLDTLAANARTTIESGYYKNFQAAAKRPKISFEEAIKNCKGNAVITEIKAASPSLGTIRSTIDPTEIAKAMQNGGAVGISVLTEPIYFNGSLKTLIEARAAVALPILFKDIIISKEQIDAAAALGANAVLLIQGLFDKGHIEAYEAEMIAYVHSNGLEVLLETHTETEYICALKTEADLIGVNNRNLDTLKTDLETTRQILAAQGKQGRVVVSESGVKSAGHIQYLRGCGADAFLVGSSIMLTDDIETKVKELVNTQ